MGPSLPRISLSRSRRVRMNYSYSRKVDELFNSSKRKLDMGPSLPRISLSRSRRGKMNYSYSRKVDELFNSHIKIGLKCKCCVYQKHRLLTYSQWHVETLRNLQRWPAMLRTLDIDIYHLFGTGCRLQSDGPPHQIIETSTQLMCMLQLLRHFARPM